MSTAPGACASTFMLEGAQQLLLLQMEVYYAGGAATAWRSSVRGCLLLTCIVGRVLLVHLVQLFLV